MHIKNSLHWTLAHVAELIARNNGYTLAEYSENSFENWIKHYRDTTEHHARNTSMSDNDIDSLRAMWLHTRQDIRKLDKQPEKKQEDIILFDFKKLAIIKCSLNSLEGVNFVLKVLI